MKLNNNKIIGIGFFAFSIVLYVYLIPSIPTALLYVSHGSLTPRSFPRFITYFLFILSFAMSVFASDDGSGVTFNEIGRTTGTVLILILYMVLMELGGFVISSIIILLILMPFYGARNRLIIASISILVPVIIFISFKSLFNTRFPPGIFWH